MVSFLTSSVISVPTHEDLRHLAGQKPIAEASGNVILTQRTGDAEGIIAVEVENKAGYVVLDGSFTDLITGRKLSGKTPITPYEVLVLQKEEKGG